MKLLGQESTLTTNVSERMTMLLWGGAGCGKTVLLATLPKPILWLQYDNEGVRSLGQRHKDQIQVFDMSKIAAAQVNEFKEGEAAEAQLRGIIREQKPATLVVDSLTSFGELCLVHAVQSGKAAAGSKDFKPTIEQPGISGYGVRNGIMLSVVRMLLRITAEQSVHLAMSTHEDSPDRDMKTGNIIRISMMLGGALSEQVPLKISEIWYMKDEGKRRMIYMRPFGFHQPMRTRMFRTQEASSFVFNYDLDTDKGLKVSRMYEVWKERGFDKMPIDVIDQLSKE